MIELYLSLNNLEACSDQRYARESRKHVAKAWANI
jgi:hypothetical protein